MKLPCKIILFCVLAAQSLVVCGQRIDSASVNLTSTPDSLFVSGAMGLNYIERVEIRSLGDALNTQAVDIYFGGCSHLTIYNRWHTFQPLQATYPYQVKICSNVDTTSTCDSLTEPWLWDSLQLPAHKIDIEEVASASIPDVRLYPNPSEARVYLEIAEETKVEKFSLYAPNGTLLREWAGRKEFLELEDYPPNIYYLIIETAKATLTRKLLLQ